MRYSAYVAGAILLFALALGMGATAATVVGWRLGKVETAGAGANQQYGTSSPEGSMLGTTSTADALVEAGIKPSDDPNISGDEAVEAMFIHRATGENSRGDYTYISNPDIDGNPHALVLVSPGPEREGNGASSYAHNIGVWYTPVAHKWAVFNQDLAAVPAGSTFQVVVPSTSASFVHRADRSNSAGNYTYLDSHLTNGNPDTELQVTQNWNPGGGGGVYNNHPVGTRYDAKVKKWAVVNRDGAPMPKGAAFNIAVSAGAKHPAS